jgi:aminopeptidase
VLQRLTTVPTRDLREVPGSLQDDAMKALHLRRWSNLILDYSLEVRRGESVAIFATPLAQDLVLALHAGILERGAWPALRISLPGQLRSLYRKSPPELIGRTTALEKLEAGGIDKRITILSAADTRETEGVDPRRISAFQRARAPLRALWKGRRWVLTLYPTAAHARDARMTTAAFERFVARALLLDRGDPARAWRAVGRRQEALVEKLRGAWQVRIEAPGTDLFLSVRGRNFVNCRGLTNLPDGEVFCAPVETSANGWIRYSFPVRHLGREVEDVRLRFRDGEIVKAEARKNAGFLRAMLGMDRGARRLGEFAIGTNYRVDRFTRSILFDEKIGGTVHLAAGSGGRNRSALHWDMICDLRRDGRLTVDGEVLLRNGRLAGAWGIPQV